MVEGALVAGLATTIIGCVIIWRVWVIEKTLNERVDGIDNNLGILASHILDKINGLASQVPDINLINQNPIGQIIDFLKGNAPNGPVNTGHPPPRDSDGQFEAVELDGEKEIKEAETH
jgi:hypothetical protein